MAGASKRDGLCLTWKLVKQSVLVEADEVQVDFVLQEVAEAAWNQTLHPDGVATQSDTAVEKQSSLQQVHSRAAV